MSATHITLFLTLLSPAAILANATSATAVTVPPEIQQAAPASTHRTIRARSGDTLNQIAQRFDIPVAELVRLNGFSENTRLKKGVKIRLAVEPDASASSGGDAKQRVGNRITLSDGHSFEVDEVWKDGDETWFRKGKVSQRLQQPVRSVKPIEKAAEPKSAGTRETSTAIAQKPHAETLPAAVWIHLVGGARFRVDEVQETNEGAWYSRGKLSIFLERERIARIERDQPGSSAPASNGRDWTSGNPMIDQLIRTNGFRFGVDPYLVFLVIEQESHFRTRALSPKGAQGLMQLMPGTARRLGVRRPFDPQENIRGGTQYLKELMAMFGGRVDLALASYNAGEGAVVRFGRNVPPYRETRDYVRRISKRYGKTETTEPEESLSAGSAPRQR